MHYPRKREVLGCSFEGFSRPEICKRRPVIVLSCSRARPGLAIVVPLSTTPPRPLQAWHYPMTRASSWDRRERWAKCDMVYAVSLKRFFPWRLGKGTDGKRNYLFGFRVSESDFTAIQRAVLSALDIKPWKDKAPPKRGYRGTR